MVELRATGDFYRTESGGLLACRAGRERLTPEWAEPVELATARIAVELGDSLDGIYLCGSVADGTSVADFSDIDLRLLLRGRGAQVPTGAKAWLRDLSEECAVRFPIAQAGLDVRFESAGDLLDHMNGLPAIQLKLAAFCMHGRDLRAVIPAPQLDALIRAAELDLIARDFPALRLQWPADLGNLVTPEDVATESARTFRQLVRWGMASVAASAGQYTWDIVIAARTWAAQRPDVKDLIDQCATLAVHPTRSVGKALRVFDAATDLLEEAQDALAR
jgi:hypothetical protein